jgi:hypothetical protein
LGKLGALENILNKHMKLIDYYPVHVDSLNEDDYHNLSTSIQQSSPGKESNARKASKNDMPFNVECLAFLK